MHLLIVGGTGFLGSHITEHATAAGHEVTVTSRRPSRVDQPAGVHRLVWDTRSPLVVDEAVDAVVNLAGANLFGHRWTTAYKRKVMESRVRTTRLVAEWAARATPRPKVLVNASAVGYYGLPEDRKVVHDGDPVGDDFLASVCAAWEEATTPASEAGVRVVLLRQGILLGQGGGALGRLEPIFKWGVGGTIGNGRHPFPWVSVEDAARAATTAIERDDMQGAYNVVAPTRDDNRDMTKALAQALHRPAVFPVPPFVLSMMYGEGANVLTNGVHVAPDRLEEAGFEWEDPDLATAFGHIYG